MIKKLLFFSIICTLAFSSSGRAATDGRLTSPAGTGSLTGAPVPNGGRAPLFSPDGGKIAFLSSTLHTPADLWVMNSDGSGARRLTTQGAQAFGWSEDGASLRFTTVRKGFAEILTLAADGAGPEKRMAGLPPGASLPAYSPDGRLFAITVPNEKKVRNLWVGTADGDRLEAVTENIGIRSVFWHPDSRKIFYEAGSQSYGVGIWEIDLATMESKSLLDKYIGTPVYSPQAGLVAYPYPVNPGEFEVHTIRLDGTAVGIPHPAPRLAGREIVWDAAGKGVYYLGQDIEKIVPPGVGFFAWLKGLFSGETAKKSQDEQTKDAAKEEAPLHNKEAASYNRVGVTSLWHLDLATNREKRISPPELHLVDFSFAPDGKGLVLAGVLQNSYTTELFRLAPETGALIRLTPGRASAWLPAPSLDSSKIAYFTNESGIDSLKVVNRQGEEVAAYPGIVQEGDTRLFWLPQSDGLLVFSGRAMLAFTEQGVIEFPGSKEHREFLGADVSIQADKVLLNSIPRYGETPGLYLLEAKGNEFVQSDLRYPKTESEEAPELYIQPRWSLDGKKIAFGDRIDIWTMNADNTGRKWLTNNAARNRAGKERPALASYPVWSVRGEMIAFTLTVFEEKSLVRQLWVMKEDGSEPKMLHSQEVDSQFQVYLTEYTSLPFFNFDDTRIIFTASDNGVPNIYAVGIADGALHRLTEDGGVFPALLPEEGVIVYTSLAGNNETLMLMGTDGANKQPLLAKAPAAKAATGEAAGTAKKAEEMSGK